MPRPQPHHRIYKSQTALEGDILVQWARKGYPMIIRPAVNPLSYKYSGVNICILYMHKTEPSCQNKSY